MLTVLSPLGQLSATTPVTAISVPIAHCFPGGCFNAIQAIKPTKIGATPIDTTAATPTPVS